MSSSLGFGIILLDKSLGLSSNTAMQRIRRGLKMQKMGHTGTLDPLATGMLPLCFGRATQLCGYFLDLSKTYQTRLVLGQQRSTGDLEGEVLVTQPVLEFSREQLEKVLFNFLGQQTQIPPMYSALKKNGKALYQLAREGIEVEREPREIFIDDIKINLIGPDYLDLEIKCSKGTYIRTLGEDIAKALGTVGYLGALRRVSCGLWQETQMYTETEILENPERCILSLEQALDWPVIAISEQHLTALLQGKTPEFLYPDFGKSQRILLKNIERNQLVGFGEVFQNKLITRKFLVTTQ